MNGDSSDVVGSCSWTINCRKPTVSNIVTPGHAKHIMVKVEKGKGRYSSSWEPHLRATGGHLPYGISGSHSVTRHPTQVNTPRFNTSQTGRYSIYLPRRDGRLSWPRWLVTYGDGLSARRRSPIQVLTGQCRLSTLIEANALTTTLRYCSSFVSGRLANS